MLSGNIVGYVGKCVEYARDAFAYDGNIQALNPVDSSKAFLFSLSTPLYESLEFPPFSFLGRDSLLPISLPLLFVLFSLGLAPLASPSVQAPLYFEFLRSSSLWFLDVLMKNSPPFPINIPSLFHHPFHPLPLYDFCSVVLV